MKPKTKETAEDYDFLKRIWKNISTRMPKLAMILGVLFALVAALDWVATGSENFGKILSLLGVRADPQQAQQLLILKGQYPLEPLSAYFEIEYKMDDPALSSFATRFQEAEVAYFNPMPREHPVSNDLKEFDALFIVWGVQHAGPQVLPGDNSGEVIAKKTLLSDSTMMILSEEPINRNIDNFPITTIRFLSMAPQEQGSIVTLPSFGKVEQAIEVYADFRKRVFIKRVRCKNLSRLGPNSTARSALDLIGRYFSWESSEVGLSQGALTKIAFGFPFSPTDAQDQQYITMPNQQVPLLLTAQQLGFAQLLSKQ